MTPQDFAKEFYLEKKKLVDFYMQSDSKAGIAKLIRELELDEKETERLKQILNGVLTDAFYTILLGLDGEIQIGSIQETYKIEDENHNVLTGGEIEASAWDYFHNNQLEFDNSESDFIATLTYRTTEEGGRKTPAKSGYRPQVKFDFEQMQTSGQQIFIDRQLVFPGDIVDAEIKILSSEYFENRLSEKMNFEFLEGSTIIGSGKIKRIVNKKLEQSR